MAGAAAGGAAAGPGLEGRPEAPVPVAVAAAVRLVPAEPVTPWVVVVVAAGAGGVATAALPGGGRQLGRGHAARQVEEHELQRLLLAVELAHFAFRGETQGWRPSCEPWSWSAAEFAEDTWTPGVDNSDRTVCFGRPA